MATVLNPKPYKEQSLPEVGKEYHIFDDDKIKLSRHSVVKVLEVLSFRDCFFNYELLEQWNDDKREYDWLYADRTDYFIKAERESDSDLFYFVRTKDGGWFSLGFFGARLDIDGSLYNSIVK